MTTPEPIELHRRRLHDLHARLAAQEDAAHAPPLWRKPGVVRTWRGLLPLLGWAALGASMMVLGFKAAEGFASGRFP